MVVGTVDIPERTDREHYFRELSYLELSVLHAQPDVKESTLNKWAAVAPEGAIGLVAPMSAELLPRVAAVAAKLRATCVVFRSPAMFSPSQANRDKLAAFFAQAEVGEGVDRVWVPDGLWEPRQAVKAAAALDVACAFDPLVREPGSPPEIYEQLEAPSLYFRIERTGTIGDAQLEDLAALVESYEDQLVRIAFATTNKWRDARNFKKLLAEV